MTRVLVCGDHDYGYDKEEWNRGWDKLTEVHKKRFITTVVGDGSRGAASMGRLWAELNGVPVQDVRATDWAAVVAGAAAELVLVFGELDRPLAEAVSGIEVEVVE